MTSHTTFKTKIAPKSFPPLRKGMSVQMDDGWRGRVEGVDGDTIVCIRNGEQPNDYLLGYRAFSRKLLTVSDGKAFVDWSAAAIPSARNRTVVVDLDRVRIEREWQSAPYCD
jgi:hypothetical protein